MFLIDLARLEFVCE